MTPWMDIARGELGVKELKGDADNPRIVEYHRWTSLHASDDETPWCSAFVNWCVGQCGIKGTGLANARSWLTWADGERCKIEPGAVAVLWRGSRVGAQGHVAFIDRVEGSTLWLLGGNQGDRVSVAPFPVERLLGCRWPKQLQEAA